jgi:hypothetical protein
MVIQNWIDVNEQDLTGIYTKYEDITYGLWHCLQLKRMKLVCGCFHLLCTHKKNIDKKLDPWL